MFMGVWGRGGGASERGELLQVGKELRAQPRPALSLRGDLCKAALKAAENLSPAAFSLGAATAKGEALPMPERAQRDSPDKELLLIRFYHYFTVSQM